MKGFILTSCHETDRQENVKELQVLLPALERVEAIYPRYEKIPFIDHIRKLSGTRTGHALRLGEIGCLLSHRKIWRIITKLASNETDMFLVFESDSHIKNIDLLKDQFDKVAGNYDLFFWGAWEGHMKLLRSSRQKINDRYIIGEPFIKSVYCTYGYSLNRNAAAYLLHKTGKVGYPVDQFKRFIKRGDMAIGGVAPELIATLDGGSYIKEQTPNRIYQYLFRKVLDVKNNLICLLR